MPQIYIKRWIKLTYFLGEYYIGEGSSKLLTRPLPLYVIMINLGHNKWDFGCLQNDDSREIVLTAF